MKAPRTERGERKDLKNYIPLDTFSSHGSELKTIKPHLNLSVVTWNQGAATGLHTAEPSIQADGEATAIAVECSRQRVRPKRLIDNLSSVHCDSWMRLPLH